MLAFKLAFAYFRTRKVRSILTMISVAVAIAALLATTGLTGSIDFVANELAGLLGGKAQLEAKGPLSGMPESKLQDIENTEGVKKAVPYIQAMVQTEEYPNFLWVMGIDPKLDIDVRSYYLTSGRMPELGAYELAVPKELLRGRSINIGDKLHLQGMSGRKEYTLVGILEDDGIARANSGEILFMPIDTAQSEFHLTGSYSYISIVLDEPKEIDSMQEKLQKSLGSGVEVRSPQGRRADLDRLLGLVKGVFNMYGSIGLFLALFVVYNSMAVAVAEQSGQIGILRAVGWRRRDTRRMIIIEALIFGIAGSLLGLILGKFLAQGLLDYVSPSIREWAKIAVPRIHLTRMEYLSALAVGIISCLVSALIPAHKAGSVTPLSAIRKDREQSERKYPRWRIVGGLIFLGLSALATGGSNLIWVTNQLSLLLFVIGTVLALPPLIVWLLSRIEIPLSPFLGIAGKLGLGAFRRAPRRTVITGMPVVLALAISLGLLSIGYSLQKTIFNWMEELIVPDLIVNQGMAIAGSTQVALPEQILQEIRQVPGVETAAGLRAAVVKWQDRNVDLSVVEVGEWRKFATPPLIEPERKQAFDVLEDEDALWASQNLALKFNLKVGQTITLPTPKGDYEFKIAGIHRDFSNTEGVFYIDRDTYIKIWDDRSIDYVDLTVEKRESVQEVRNRIEESLQGRYKVNVQLASDFKETSLKVSASLTDILNLVVVIAILVGAIGIINSLLISVMQRTHEIGTLRSLGMLRSQIRSMFLLEVGALLVAGLFLAIPLGAYLFELGAMMQKNVNGWILDRYIPWITLILMTFAMAALCLFSALYPARLASKIDIVEALRSE